MQCHTGAASSFPLRCGAVLLAAPSLPAWACARCAWHRVHSLQAKQSTDALSTVCGTPQYVAPEVIQSVPNVEYGPPVS